MIKTTEYFPTTMVPRPLSCYHEPDRELPKMDGTAQYGWGHDRPPQDGYRGTRGE